MATHLTSRQKYALRELAALSYDSRKGFLLAVHNIPNPTLKEILLDYSSQRTAFAVEVKKVLGANGHFRPVQGSLSGVIHRGWISFKSLFMKNDTEAMIAECLMAEKIYLKRLKSTLKRTYDDNVQELLGQQLRETEQCIAVLDATLEFLPARNTILFDETIRS